MAVESRAAADLCGVSLRILRRVRTPWPRRLLRCSRHHLPPRAPLSAGRAGQWLSLQRAYDSAHSARLDRSRALALEPALNLFAAALAANFCAPPPRLDFGRGRHVALACADALQCRDHFEDCVRD